ncbi:MAG: XdhC family protein [Silicimonas sp.]|jgi:xanthine dehydrogenase accessory factor|nr:XdhC family protein [Silicimonas sp.]
MDQHDSIPETALAWIKAGRKVALATVVKTWGSAPRPVGAGLVIDGQMAFEGSVSGGCVEGAVITEALEAMEDGTCRVLSFGVSDDTAFEVGLACGGQIEVMVEPVGVGQGPSVEELEALVAARAARRPVIREVDTENWARRLIERDTGDAALEALFRNDKSAREGTLFRGVHNPPLRLALIGAVHIAQPLVVMARLAGYDIVLCDPRDSFASGQRFPGERFLDGWPDEALEAFGLDARTAVVTLSHDPKIDTPAIQAALASEAFYIGALGSTRTHAKRIEALKEAGLSEAQIARIDGPVGLDIGAASPAEIAVSIMAEMTERLRRPETRPGGA